MSAALPLLDEDERIRRAMAVLLHDAKLARDDPGLFFEFVMRHEVERTPLTLQPHQRLLYDFVLDHPECVIILPIGTSKTFAMGALGLWLLGQDPTSRGGFVSGTQGQAAKPLGALADYITESHELRLVFPHLRKSQRRSDEWSSTAITVDRPPGIRDASFAAYGMDAGSLPGARLKWLLVDDLLNRENTNTPDQRQKVDDYFTTTVFPRLDPRGGRCVVSNTAWHPDDQLHRLIKRGWAGIRMEVEGDIQIYNADDWDRDYLRPKHPGSELCRLVVPGRPDPLNDSPLWPGRYDRTDIAKLKGGTLPVKFNQLYRGLPHDDDTALCQQAWIDKCKLRARQEKHHDFVSTYAGENLVFCGVDLAVSPGEENDDVCFFTFEALPSGLRKILEIDRGQWNGPTIVKKLLSIAKRYRNVVLRVENNAAQDFIRQFALEADISLPVKAHTTGRAKAHPEYGVPALFVEIMNGAWLIPNDRFGRVHPVVQQWIDGCLYYRPSKHTDDSLMAMWFAQVQAREFGVLSGADTAQLNGAGIGSIIMSR